MSAGLSQCTSLKNSSQSLLQSPHVSGVSVGGIVAYLLSASVSVGITKLGGGETPCATLSEPVSDTSSDCQSPPRSSVSSVGLCTKVRVAVGVTCGDDWYPLDSRCHQPANQPGQQRMKTMIPAKIRLFASHGGEDVRMLADTKSRNTVR